MNILQVIPYYPPAWSYGGPGPVAFDLTNQLASRGHRVTVYTTDAGGREGRVRHELPSSPGVTIRRFTNLANFAARRYRLFWSPGVARSTEAEISKFDIVHLHDFRTLMNATVCTRAAVRGIPVVLQAHGSLSTNEGNRALKKAYDVLEGRRVIQSVTAAIALNEVEAHLYSQIGIDARKVATIPNAIDTDNMKLDVRGVSDNPTIPRDARVVLYLGRLHASKRVDLLVKAFEIVRQKERKAYLILAGPDDGFAGKIRRLVRNRSLESCVLMTGFVENGRKLGLLASSDVLVVPAFSGFPVTFLEACTYGTPIITTTASDPLDWVHDQVGLIVNPDPESLARGILQVLSNRTTRERYAANGPDLVRGRFSWNAVLGSYLAVYTDCIERTKPMRQ